MLNNPRTRITFIAIFFVPLFFRLIIGSGEKRPEKAEAPHA